MNNVSSNVFMASLNTRLTCGDVHLLSVLGGEPETIQLEIKKQLKGRCVMCLGPLLSCIPRKAQQVVDA